MPQTTLIQNNKCDTSPQIRGGCSPPLDVWRRQVDLSVEPSRPQQGGVKHVGPVGSGQDHNSTGGIETCNRMCIHFKQAGHTTPHPVVPSISTRSWFKVFSRSSCPPNPPLLFLVRPTASISSMNMMQGAFLRA